MSTLRKVIAGREVPSRHKGGRYLSWYRLSLECGHTTWRKGAPAKQVVCSVCRQEEKIAKL